MMHTCCRDKRRAQRTCTPGRSIHLACTGQNKVDLGLLKAVFLWESIRMGMLSPLPSVKNIEIKSSNELLEPRLISLADMCKPVVCPGQRERAQASTVC